MKEQVRYRVPALLKKEAEQILENIGIPASSAIAMFYAQVVRLQGLPFRPGEFPVLDEYGATIEDADAAEEAVIRDFKRERAAGKTVEFKGKL